jgi:hypothetical protein
MHGMRWVRLVVSAGALVAALAPAAQAQVVYSGLVNLTIPNNFDGLFVNVVTGTAYAGPGFPVCPGPGCGYDFNLFGSTAWDFFNPGSSGQSPSTPVPAAEKGLVAATTSSAASSLLVGSVIGASSTFNTGAVVSASNLLGGTDRYFGFRFRNEGSTPTSHTVHFGWARVRLVNGQAGTLVDYAFNATPGASITVGPSVVVPEPSTYALIGTGLAMLVAVRRRRTAR